LNCSHGNTRQIFPNPVKNLQPTGERSLENVDEVDFDWCFDRDLVKTERDFDTDEAALGHAEIIAKERADDGSFCGFFNSGVDRSGKEIAASACKIG
jgi:hypothetical protein